MRPRLFGCSLLLLAALLSPGCLWRPWGWWHGHHCRYAAPDANGPAAAPPPPP
jgi:hypothetical protein